MRREGVAEALLVASFVALPLATSANEVTTALALVAALASPTRGALLGLPWGRAALGAALAWVLLVPASGDLREGLGHAWLLAPLVAVPALAAIAPTDRAARAGLAAAGLAAAWALVQRAGGGVGTAGMSHHLSLAYALLPPLGVATRRRSWRLVALLAGGVLATGSAGATLALVATLTGALTGRPGAAALLWAAATVALLPLADPSELGQRAVLWTGGLQVAAAGPTGPGAYPAASAPAYDALSPGFWFPNHAHDSAVQLLAVLGPVGLVATLALVERVLRRGDPGAAAGLAGVLVGGLTQDVLGDLEVARAAWAWAALFGAAPPLGVAPRPEPADAHSGNPPAGGMD